MANESNWRQPAYVPLVGGQDNAYPADAAPWASTTVVVDPGAGPIKQGLTPGPASWFTAQTANYLLNLLGKHLDAIADESAFQWIPYTAHIGNVSNAYSQFTNTATPNTNDKDDHPLVLPHSGGYHLFYAAKNIGSGDVGSSAVAESHLSQGYKYGGDTETFQVIMGNKCGLTGDTVNHRGCPIGGGRSGTLVALGDARTTAYSTDHGQTWTAGPTIPASGVHATNNALCTTFFAGKWYAVDDVSNVGNVSSMAVSSDPTASWARLATDTIGARIRRFASNSTTLLLLPAIDTKCGVFHDGDTSITAVNIIPADSSKTGWRAAWNDNLQLFGLVNAQGGFYTSADGLSWGLANAFGGSGVFRDIVAHGRGFLVSNDASTFAVDYLDQTPERTWRLRRSLQAFDASIGGGFHLARVRGRVIAARTVKPGSDAMRVEWYASGISAYDRFVQVGE